MQQAVTTPPLHPSKPEEPTKQETPARVGVNISGLDLKSSLTKEPTKDVSQRYDYAYVASDLRKIVILATAAVALEIILNLTTRASFAKLILRTLGIEI